MKKILLSFLMLIAAVPLWALVVDEYEYPSQDGIICKNKWIFDRVHSPEIFTNLPFVANYYSAAPTATIDPIRKKIYIGHFGDNIGKLVIINLEIGKYEKQLPLTCDGVAITGTCCTSQVGVDDYGNVWFCGGMYTDINTSPAQIYIIEDLETGVCKNIGEWKLPDDEVEAIVGRIDYWNVVGDITGKKANAVCMAVTKNYVYRWELAQGATEWKANNDIFAGKIAKQLINGYPEEQDLSVAANVSSIVEILPEDGYKASKFYIDATYTYPTLYNTSLEIEQSFADAPDLVPAVTQCNGVTEFTLNGEKYIAYVENQYNKSPGCRVKICKLGENGTFAGMKHLWDVPESGLGEVSDGGRRIHIIDTYKVVDNNGKEGVYLFTYKCYNGFGLYLIAEDGFEDLFPDVSKMPGYDYLGYKFTIEGLTYEVIDTDLKKVKIVGNDGSLSGTIVVLSTIANSVGNSYIVTEIGSEAFANCPNLMTLDIHENIENFEGNYLNGNEQNLEIIMRSTNPPGFADPYEGHDKSHWVLRIPVEAYSQYEAQGWIEEMIVKDFDGNILHLGKPESVGEQFTIKGLNYEVIDTDLKKVKIVGNDGSLSGTIVVSSVSSPKGNSYTVTEIDSEAFANCPNLMTLDIHENIESFGTNYLNGNEQNLEIIMRSTNPPGFADPYEGHDKSHWVLRIPVEAYSQYEAQGWIEEMIVKDFDGNILHLGKPESVGEQFTIKGLNYEVIDADLKKVKIIGNDGSLSGTIVVSSVSSPKGNSYTVTEIGSEAFANCPNLMTLDIHENIECFYDNYLNGNNQNLEIIMRSTNPPGFADPYYGHDKSHWVLRIPMDAYYQYEALGWTGNIQVIDLNDPLPEGWDPNYPSIEYIKNKIKYRVVKETKKAKVIGYESGLTGEVKIPNSIDVDSVDCKVVEIADTAFANCTGMTKIVIGENITTIGHVIFMGCTGLTEVEWNAINCTNYKFEAFLSLFRGSYHIYSEMLGCSFEFPEFDIRNQITSFKFGDKVEHIPALSCWGLSNVKSIEVPASVKSIGMYSFNEMSGLTSFSIQGNESYCFDEETGILYNADKTNAIVGFPAMISSDVVLPQSVTTVSRCAFLGCNNLKSITFNENIQSIEDHIFIGCDGLQEIVWNVPDYKRDQYHYDSQLGFLYSTVNAPYLGEDVAYDLRGQITSLKFGENITTIHDNIFRYMTNISSLSIPSNVTTIIGSAFTGWNNLANIEVGAVVPPTMEYYAFSNYENITVVVPPGCVDIYKANQNWGQFRNIVGPRYTDENGIVYELISETEAKVVARTEPYSGHVKLSSTIKDDKGNDIKVTTIGEYAFCDCGNLISIDIPETITTIKSYAFGGCTQLKIDDIPMSITAIEDYAFWGCSQMTSLTIHENITSIGSSAFHETSIVNVEWNAINLYNNGVSFLPSTVKNINFGDAVEYIPMYACQGLVELKSVVIPDAVKKIDVYAFDNCTSLSEVKIGKSVTDIMYLAFGNCIALENIVIPNATTNIDYAAFQGCSYLKNVTIGSGVKNIGEYAFDGCLRLEKVTVKATSAPSIAGANAFTSDTYRFAELSVKYGYKSVYEKELYWRNFETITEESSPNHFEIESSGMNASRGGKFSIPLNLVNDNEIAGFQADIYMPSGFSVATNGGEYEIELSGRASPSHSISYNVMSDGALRIVAYSTDAKAFDGNEGVVVNINVKVAENFNGSSSVEVKNVVMTSPTNVEFKCSDVAFDVTIKDPETGNANGEGDVNVTDVIATANYIVGDNTAPIDLTNADVNADGEVNVVDVVGISSIILGTNSATAQVASMDGHLSVKTMHPYALTANNLFIEDFSIEPGQEKEISIMLTNDVAFTAFQADLYLPVGLRVKGNVELTSRKVNHTILSSKQADGAIRILSYSATNRDYNDEEGALLTFAVVADNTFNGGKLAIKNVIFSQRDMKVYKFNNTETKVWTSGIENVFNDGGVSISIISGEIVVNGVADAQIAVYNVNGMLIYQGVNRPVAVANKGVYIVIVNGSAIKVAL